MITMLVDYGRLRKGKGYRVQAVGWDWVRAAGIYIPRDFVEHTCIV